VPGGRPLARLVGEHVETGPHRAGVERLDQGRFVDHVAARGVEQDRAVLQAVEELVVDQVLGLGRGRHVQRHDVAVAQQVRERVAQLDPERLDPLGGVRRAARLGQRLEMDAERRRPLGDTQADRAEAQDAHRLAEEAVGLAVALLVPPALPQVGDVVGDPTVDRQQQTHRQLRDGGGVAPRHVRDQHTAAGRRVGVDGVGPRTGADHQRKPVGSLEDLAADLRAPHDQCVEPLDPARQIVGAQPGVHDDLVAA
jgi:hypothetical protein